MAYQSGTRQVKGFHQAIKDLRRDLEDGGRACNTGPKALGNTCKLS
jgi:hypothetical protein